MYISITKLELKSITKIFKFVALTKEIKNQLNSTEGVLSWEAIGFPYTFWTRSSWESKEQMSEFMKSGAHAIAMKNSRDIASQIYSYGYESNSLPTWKEAKEILKNQLK